MNTRLFLYQFAKAVHLENPDYVVFGVEKKDKLLEIHVVHDDKGTSVLVPKKEIPVTVENTEIIYLLANKTIAKLKIQKEELDNEEE